MDSEFLTERQAAAYLGVSPRTLQGWRQRGVGPSWVKYGDGRSAAIRYGISHLKDFAGTRLRAPTNEAA